jgi:hypothetical protein
VVWDLRLHGDPGGPTSITSTTPHPKIAIFYIATPFSVRGTQSSAYRITVGQGILRLLIGVRNSDWGAARSS